ncbi:MAG: hypothetical protein J6N93_08465 [Clostridia bacterium]|nr:hypothetical protein [Clostridia bacterium]
MSERVNNKLSAKRTNAERAQRQRADGVAPNKLELLITVVNKKKADFFADLIQSFDCNMQIKILGKGAANTEILEYLGLSGSEKIALFSVIRSDRKVEILEALDEKFKTIKNGKGVAVTTPFSSVIGKLVYGFLSNDERMIQGE